MKYEVNKYVENKRVKRTMWFDTGGVWSKIGMSQQTVSRIEKNIDSLDIKTLKIISQYFHVPINYIIGEDTKKYNMYVHESSISVLAEYPFINQYLLSLDPEALKHINEALKIQYAKEDNECLILQ